MNLLSLVSTMSVETSISSPVHGEAVLLETGRKSVVKRVAIDAFTAMTAAVTVSPIVATVDK
jgi:hypothetical protein